MFFNYRIVPAFMFTILWPSLYTMQYAPEFLVETVLEDILELSEQQQCEIIKAQIIPVITNDAEYLSTNDSFDPSLTNQFRASVHLSNCLLRCPQNFSDTKLVDLKQIIKEIVAKRKVDEAALLKPKTLFTGPIQTTFDNKSQEVCVLGFPSCSMNSLEPLAQKISTDLQSNSYREMILKSIDQRNRFFSAVRNFFGKTNSVKEVSFLKLFLDGSIVQSLAEVKNANLKNALTIYAALKEAWPFASSQEFITRTPSYEEQEFIQILGGVDIMQAIERDILSRNDFLHHHGCSLAEVQIFSPLQQQGNVRELQKQRDAILIKIKNHTFLADNNPILIKVQLAEVDRLLADNITHINNNIARADKAVAKAELQSLEVQLISTFDAQGLITRPDAKAYMIQQKGFDLLENGHKLYKSRADCAKNLPLLNGKLTRFFLTIKDAPLDKAFEELAHVKQQIASQIIVAGITTLHEAKAYIIDREGFDLLDVAEKFLAMRPDQQKPLTIEDIPGIIPNAIHFQPMDVEQDVCAALDMSTYQKQAAFKLNEIAKKVFANAYNLQIYVQPELKQLIESSLHTIATTKNTTELVFNITAVSQILTSLQQQLALTSSITQRSPELLAFAIEKFIYRLNPYVQIKNQLEFVISAAHFVGKFCLRQEPLTEAECSEWAASVYHTVKGLSNLSAAQWITITSECAADLVSALGVGNAIAYLKEIDALGKVEQKLASITQELKAGVDTLLSKRPILITTEGIAVQAPRTAEELVMLKENIQKSGSAVKEVIKDSKSLLQAESKIQVATSTGTKLKHPPIITSGPLCHFTQEAIEASVKYAMKKPAKYDHIFEKARHNLDQLIKTVGGESNLAREVSSALSGKVHFNEQFTDIIVHIAGYEVYTRGRVMDGALKLGTIFVKES